MTFLSSQFEFDVGCGGGGLQSQFNVKPISVEVKLGWVDALVGKVAIYIPYYSPTESENFKVFKVSFKGVSRVFV